MVLSVIKARLVRKVIIVMLIDQLLQSLVNLLVPLLTHRVRILQLHMVDLGIEGVPLVTSILHALLKGSLLFMHRLFVGKRVLVEDFVLFLLQSEVAPVRMVIRKFVGYLALGVIGPYELVAYFDLVCAALLNQLVVLSVAHHALFALLKALPLLILDHGGVGVHILALELDLFEFFG